MVEREEPGPPLRVILADDDPMVRRALRDGLQAAGTTVVAEAPTGRDAVDLAVHYRPDVVVMDVVMPGVGGVDATAILQQRAPEVSVLLLTSRVDPEVAVLGLRTGAAGFMAKGAAVEEVSDAIRRVRNGEMVVDHRVVRELVTRARRLPETGVGLRPVSSPLTDREWEVLDGMCVGMSPEEVAAALVVSVETVRSHMKHLFRKLGVHSRDAAVALAGALRQPSPPLNARRPPNAGGASGQAFGG